MDAYWPLLVEVEGSRVRDTALTFSSNGKYILRDGDGEVVVWRVSDGERVARMEVRGTITSLVVSSDGRWIAAGAEDGVHVWDANTYEQAFAIENDDGINSIDFSPDSSRLVTASDDCVVIVWDTATQRQVLGPLEHDFPVSTVKYSPQGNRIATATSEAIRIYDSYDGRLRVNTPMDVTTVCDNSFVWLGDELFVMAHDKVKRIETSTGTTIFEWQVLGSYSGLAIALPIHGEFFAYSARETITFWDTSMQHQLGHIDQARNIGTMVFSPDGRFLAISEENGMKVMIRDVSRNVVPFMDIPNSAYDAWIGDQLMDAEELLTTAINTGANHHSYANRALVRARLGYRGAAIDDAKRSIDVQPSMIGYIAKSVALIGQGNKDEMYSVFDLAFRHIQSHEVDHLLLMKAVVLFMAGEHDVAISRVSNLIATLRSNSTCYMVRAYMYLLRGGAQMGNNEYERAIQSYKHARTQTRSCVGSFLRTITFISGWKFDDFHITIQQRLCEALFAAGRTKEAGECLVEMINSFNKEAYVRGSVSKWVSSVYMRRPIATVLPTVLPNFEHQYTSAFQAKSVLDLKPQCAEKMMHFGDIAADTQRHEDAIAHYSAILSLELAAPQEILVKRSKVRAELGLWDLALDDANEAIACDPSSPWGYERKYVALGVARHHRDMYDAFETMLSKMAQSSDPEIRARGQRYPKTQQTIRRIIQETIRELPRFLINTTSGRLYGKSEQEVAFELSSDYAELASTMTTKMDRTSIERDVRAYYRYAMFSHRCQTSEPLFEELVSTSVYELAESLTNEKLQKFCNIVRDSGIRWAWSSTCCIDTTDNSVLQEALTSMFRWYEKSSLTIIYLVDICSPSQDDNLIESVWSSRAWLFQEYHASRVVRFYNNDWTIYKNIDVPNHKVSPEIVSDVEMATGISEEDLIALRPGLGNIRVKLRLASTQETTLAEDAAYSLFGIFSVSLPVVYGEGDKALGHLLSYLLAESGDTSILAWTGVSGSFNSCLPSNTMVFREPSASHVQPDMEEVDLDAIVLDLRASSLNIVILMKLIERLKKLSTPLFVGQQMRLPCIAIKLAPLTASSNNGEKVYHIQTAALKDVEIRTEEDLSRFHSLYIIHPWIDFLIDRLPVGNEGRSRDQDSDDEASVDEVLAFPIRSNSRLSILVRTHATQFVTRMRHFRHRDRSISPSRSTPSIEHPSQGSKQMKAVRFAVRLKQPFEALLIAADAVGNGATYRRIAAGNRVTAQVANLTPFVLKQLVDGVRVLDVL